MFERERTKPCVIRYLLYLYFLELSLRSVFKALEIFVERTYVAVWRCILHAGIRSKTCIPNKKKSRITAFAIDGWNSNTGWLRLAWVRNSDKRTNQAMPGVYNVDPPLVRNPQYVIDAQGQ
jgi:hypothetical protein